MKYYPARLAGTYSTAALAFNSIGFTIQWAEELVKNAALNQSPAVFAQISEDKGVVVTQLSDGSFGLWQACLELCATEEHAASIAMEIDKSLKKKKGSAWAVFAWNELIGRAVH
jgi:hypothetical protein